MPPRVYACKNRDEQIRRESTSGGVFTLLAQRTLAERGAVYGAVFGDDWTVEYARAEVTEELAAMRGSKYPQADVGDALKDVRRDLEAGRPVLFVGTPCQVRGLRLFLGREYERLVCVDFVCFGIGSPGVWRDYLAQRFPGQKVESVWFKDKRAGWHKFTTVIRTDRGETAAPGPKDPYLGSYLAGCNIRPCCYSCRFKGTQGHTSDLTISDSWGIDRIKPAFDDDKGISNVFVNTPKGARAFGAVRGGADCIEISFDKAVQGNPYYERSKTASPRRDRFWSVYRSKGVLKAFRAAVPRRPLVWLKRSVGRLIRR